MAKKDISSLRSTLDYLRDIGELVATDSEVDPHLEVAAIQKHFDGGAPLLFEKVKGYPNARIANNVFATAERISRIFDVDDPKKFKFKAVEAIRSPIPPREVKDAPCQEVVITRDIDVWDVIPMISHASSDPGRTMGAGNTVVRGKYFWNGSHIGYNRQNFRGPDFSSFQISPGSHMDQIATHWYGKGPIPMTINIGVPPACTMMAGAGFTYVILPRGCDELGVAGALQGFPVEVVKARTQDAWAIANAEYVIEGYLDMTQKVWESPLAEKEGEQGKFDFHPEWSGYMGKAYRTYKFQATAITHRSDRPIYYGLIVHGMDDHFIDCTMREACFLELAERIVPGLCIDTNIPMGLTDWGGVIFQVKKRRARDEGLHRNILSAALSISLGAKLGIVVDEDIDIYNAEDVLWAMTTRMNPRDDIFTVCEGAFGQTFQPAERSSAGERQWTQANIRFAGATAIDATRPFVYKDAFRRARYEVEMVDLRKFYTEEQVRKAKASQRDYAKFMADRGI
jgi:4-hydroxy-3-polyprenylbenzoate decarboxylase